MDREEYYQRMMIDLVLPDIKKKMPINNNIIVQQDGAYKNEDLLILIISYKNEDLLILTKSNKLKNLLRVGPEHTLLGYQHST
jgi:hypothetical protein